MGGKKIKNQKLRGFTLLEVVVATFIFVLIMVTVIRIFGSGFSGYRKAKAVQKDLESAQQNMNMMAKVFRTSQVVWSSNWSGNGCVPAGYDIGTPNGSDAIRIFDYSQYKCYRYEFTNSKTGAENELLISSKIPTAAEDKTACNTTNWPLTSSDADVAISKNVIGDFEIQGYSCNAGAMDMSGFGKITIAMKVCPDIGCNGNPNDQAPIQTTVSLRNQKEVP
jgi:type II secretory pathway pseudopilin PulG